MVCDEACATERSWIAWDTYPVVVCDEACETERSWIAWDTYPVVVCDEACATERSWIAWDTYPVVVCDETCATERSWIAWDTYIPGSGLENFLRPSNMFKAELGTLDTRKVKASRRVIKPRRFIGGSEAGSYR